jgi:hypothetical protein
VPLGVWLVATTLGVLLFAVLVRSGKLAVEIPGELSVLVMKRRRSDPGTDHGPDAEPGLPEDPTAGPPAASQPVVRAATAATAADAAAPPNGDPSDVDAALGRTGSAGREPRRFAARPATGVERRIVAYQSVRVSAGPDDLRSAELTRLDRRDEVEVLGDEAGFLRIRTADGIEGWVPRVVLVGAPTVDRPAQAGEPESPTTRGRWRVHALRREPPASDPAGPPARP